MNTSLVLFQFSKIHTLLLLSDPIIFLEVSTTSLLSLCPLECMVLSLTRCRSQGLLANRECATQRLHAQNRPLISNHPHGLAHLKTEYYIY